MRDIVVDRVRGRLWARVGPENRKLFHTHARILILLPVSLPPFLSSDSYLIFFPLFSLPKKVSKKEPSKFSSFFVS